MLEKGIDLSRRTLCVFTPTYNRAYSLPDLYKSLEGQNCSDQFVWFIVDDGSTDDTEEYIRSIQSKSSFPIKYEKVENGGKQRALNLGAQVCEQELFFCVDSDDMVAPCAIQLILDTWHSVETNKKCAGIIGLDIDKAGKNIGTSMPAELKWVTSIDLYEKYGFKGDTAKIYRTDILREYPYHVASNEKFISENYVYYEIDQKYVLRVLDEPLLVVEYRPDGYTANVRRITKENPISYYRHKRRLIEYHSKISSKFEDTILYLVGCDLANKRDWLKDAPIKSLAVLAWLPAKILRHTVYR